MGTDPGVDPDVDGDVERGRRRVARGVAPPLDYTRIWSVPFQGRGVYCLSIGGVQIDRAVSEALLDAMRPAGLQAGAGRRRAD